jgi:hypothetical protein
VRICIVILSGKKGSGRNHVTNFLRNHVIISQVNKKEKLGNRVSPNKNSVGKLKYNNVTLT